MNLYTFLYQAFFILEDFHIVHFFHILENILNVLMRRGNGKGERRNDKQKMGTHRFCEVSR